MNSTLIFALLVAFLVSLISIKILVPIAHKVGLVDQPDARKTHQGAIPLVGGIAISISLFLAVFTLTPASPKVLTMLNAATLLLIVGVIDDFKPIGVKIRILIQIIASAIVITSTDLQIHSLGNLFGLGDIKLGWLSLPFTIIAVVGITNAFNLIDGIDGLAGSLTLVAISGILIFQFSNGIAKNLEYILLLSAALLPYLYYNLKAKSKIFMGDAGSTFIGFIIAWTLINLSQGEPVTISPTSALWCVAIPLIDTIGVMFRRIIKRQSPFKPDRTHLHHILIRTGLSSRGALVVLVFFSNTLLLIGILTELLAPALSFIVFIAAFTLYLYGLRRAWRLQRFIKRSRRRNAR
ncbi:UDP-N-acetylglucosamine--undecaprenyl-phosphate N-acetylglucosaminephosphotransferase [Neptuniibacter sp. CAU 1671]|uniref:UDP-N-acetylglucosamine--undecaprenyl-phosphate N-acetylglucosaminephosphotransferase n=1 Tax=Neptuniibacter sp. CAU 1671 TaxID=3032593 RepID=UPI0023DB29DC|nr:UDP-N-acetylglucosamine--undecaprenyl-phosphate N-acetylglucosaminephosphotransferase [Neptuniibacter sp. CAU 1671]MDF2181418.1 UDP-N-acetylglucosamine--undecaprenyl-phosphate N-acetylglucosaminephosphotransferase [Neptuniibacter sp. CAU 1671]